MVKVFLKKISFCLFFVLIPFYWLGAALVWLPFRLGWRRQQRFPQLLTIKVGNLSVGGTGKTPHVAFLLQELLKISPKVSIVSRGYGRKTKNMRRVSIDSAPQDVGDEPLWLQQQQPDALVFVARRRAEALQHIIADFPDYKLALLDDGLQHWAVEADKNILLTTFAAPFFADFLLPAGRLRESRAGAKRADVIIISQCPPQISDEQRQFFTARCRAYAPNAPVFFSYYNYTPPALLGNPAELLPWQQLAQTPFLLLTAIAQTDYLRAFLAEFEPNLLHLPYPDHHNFTAADLQFILETAEKNELQFILTTEKDATRLAPHIALFVACPIYVLPIQVNFHGDDQPQFMQLLHDWSGDFFARLAAKKL
jgi:tetraacyldisaccharide 4'-kinase